MRNLGLNVNNWNPYKGIWYRNDPTTEYYAGGQATFPSNIRPMAIYIASVSKTFFTFADKDSQIVVGEFNHVTQLLSAPVVVGSYTDDDAHKNGAILIDHDGYIYVFYGGHGETSKVRRSSLPLDIRAWQTAVTLPGGTSVTYFQPWEVASGKIMCLSRLDGVGQEFLISNDQAATWTPTTFLANNGTDSAYFISVASVGSFPRTVHVIWNLYEGPTMRRNFYHAETADGGTTWKKSDGTTLTLPIAITAGELILNSGSEQVNTCDLQLDSTGLVRALVLQGLGTSFVWKLIRQNSAGSWSVFTLPPAADHHFDIGSLILVSDDDWRAYLPSDPNLINQDGGEIEEWQSLDRGSTWAKIRVLTSGSTFVHNNVKSVVNGQSDFRAFWSYGDPDVAGLGTPKTKAVDLFMAGDSYTKQMNGT